MAKSNIPATVVMSCLHTFTSYIRPRAGDVLWCPKCQEYKEWTSAVFKVAIHCDSCAKLRGRGYGGQIEAEASAIRHAHKYRGHTTTVTINGERSTSVYHKEPDRVLPSGQPPF